MKKEKQIGVRVGMPAFFVLELEDTYKRSDGAHRALAFPDFVGLLVGLGLEAYRQGKTVGQTAKEEDDSKTSEDDWDWQEESPRVLKQFP